MSYEADFDAFMPLTVSWEQRVTSGTSGYGDEDTFAPAVSIQCRIEQADKVIRDKDGYEHMATAVIYTSGFIGIQPADRITLPDGTHLPIVTVDQVYDDEGPHHENVYLTA